MTFPSFGRLPGIEIGHASRRVRLDLFLDLQCPYSKKSWDVIGEAVSNEWKDHLSMSFHPICLSHHRQSWDLARALSAIHSIDESGALAFISAVYAEQDQFYNAAWKSKGQDEFLSHLAAFAREMVDCTASDFINRIESDDNYSKSKKSIHYAAVKQVWSTPTFFFNEVPADGLDSSSSLKDWNEIISGLDF
jgi:protein-disulfide isomerase